MRRRAIIAAAALAVSSLGVFAPQAFSQSATICINAKIVANGQVVVDESRCETLPPPQ